MATARLLRPRSGALLAPGVLIGLLIGLLVIAVLPAPPAIAQPSVVWPTGDGDLGASRRSSDVGPDTPGIAWVTAVADIDVPGAIVTGPEGNTGTHGYDMVGDADGHLVATVGLDYVDGSGTDYVLLALDRDDGEVAWMTEAETPAIVPQCGSVIDSTGQLWTLAEVNEDNVLPVRIDSTDGTVADSPLAGEAGLPDTRAGNGCAFPPVLTPDDLLIYQLRTFDQPIVAIDLSDGTLAWTFDLDGAGLGGRADWVVPSADGSQIVVGSDGDATVDGVSVTTIDVGDGTQIDSRSLPGERYYTVNDENAAVALDDGGVVFGVDAGDLDGTLVRLDDDLSTAWSTPTSTTSDVTQPHPIGTLAIGGAEGQLVLGWSISSPNQVFAYSLADGSLAWAADTEAFDSTVSITVGADGNAYVGLFDREVGLQVIGPDGTVGATLGQEQFDPGEGFGSPASAVGPLIDGLLFTVFESFGDALFVGVDDSGSGLIPGVSRPAGTSDDPRQIAIDLCQRLNPADGSARAVVLAQDEIFADALTGSPLAGDDGCVLFTGRAPQALHPPTAAEIERALPAGGTVYLLGGESAIDASVAGQLAAEGFDVQRLAGAGRIQTAVAIADEVRRLNPENTAALLAFEGNWPDAVAGGAYGAETGTPILLVRTDSIPTETAAALSGVDDVTILGSTGVISAAVEDALTAATVDRAGGENRMATAVAITERLWLADTSAPGDRFLMVNLEAANAWTIALAAAPLSAREDAPQLGVGNSVYPMETMSFLDAQGFTELPALGLIGGLAFIGEDIEGAIDESISS